MNRFIRIVGIFSVFIAWSGSAAAVTIRECAVSGMGQFPTGEMFDGTYSDTDGIETIDWTHDAAGASFETTAVGNDAEDVGDGVICRQNGRLTGTILSHGTGTYNEDPGYSYYLFMEDNRPAPDSVLLVASITYHPTNRNEGIANFGTPRSVVIPAEIAVAVGGSGRGKTRLILNDNVTCTYLGTGTAYAFDRCTDPLDSGYVAGDSIDVSQIRLRIQQADRSFILTSVEVGFGTGPVPGTPDFYELVIFDPGGVEVYRFIGSVDDGDIAITLLGDSPVP